MITVIAATNRHGSYTRKVATIYYQLLKEKYSDARFLSLEDLPDDFLHTYMYDKRSNAFQDLLDKKIIPAKKLVFVCPEYNGSIPGILKLFIDGGDIVQGFRGKRVALVGVATGRAGNLRGLDHLTDIIHHIGTEVLAYKIPISQVDKLMNAEGQFITDDTPKLLQKQIDLLLKF